MDNKKDIEYKTDGQGVMNETDYFSFLLGRAEKLSSAVYLVTNLVSDMEPIKWVMREKSLLLLSDMSAAEHAPLSDRMELLEIAEEAARELSSLIAIARAGQIISPMNADMLIASFLSLRDAIRRGTGISTSAETIVSELLKGDEGPLLEKGNIYKGQKDNGNVFYNRTQRQESESDKVKYPNQGQRHFSANISKKETADNRENTKVDRRKTIVDFVRKMREVTIKDVLQVVSGCSEKTIQRELVALVKDNVLKKEGERRWSRYSLK